MKKPSKEVVYVSSGGLGGAAVLGLIFVTLKVAGLIDWSWWLVTLPFWALWALVLGVLVLGVVGCLLVMLTILGLEWYQQRKTDRRLVEASIARTRARQ